MAIVAAARECIGTPFHHQGRLIGVGMDCVGLILHAARAVGVETDELPNYGRYPNKEMMLATLRKYMDETHMICAQDGDVVWLRVRRNPQHLAILCNDTKSMVHSCSYPTLMRCVEQPLDASWASRIVGVFRFKGVA